MSVRDDEPDRPEKDDDLWKAFAALRREDATRTPTFEALLAHADGAARRGRRDLLWSVGGLAVAAAVLVAVIVGVAVRRPAPMPSPMVSLEQWTAPTAFLLRTPGLEILETVPRIGSPVPRPQAEGASGGRTVPKRRSESP